MAYTPGTQYVQVGGVWQPVGGTLVGTKNVMDVNLAASAGDTAAVTGVLTGNGISVTAACINSGNATITITGGTYTNLPIIFEASADGGTTYFTVDATQADGTGVNTAMTIPVQTTRAWNVYLSGYTHVRVRQTAAAGTQTVNPTVGIYQGPFLFDPSPIVAPIDGQKATYTSNLSGLATNLAGDSFVLTGSATRTVRVTRVDISLQVTTAATVGTELRLIKRTTADSAGTAGGTVTTGPLDTTDPAATAVVTAYTVAPTPGTTGAIVRATRMPLAVGNYNWLYDFGNRPSRAPVLRGTTQQFAINQLAVATTGVFAWTYTIEWTEE